MRSSACTRSSINRCTQCDTLFSIIDDVPNVCTFACLTCVYLKVLTQLESLGAKVTDTTVLNIMRAYEVSGDINSIREVFSRFNSTGSAASTVAVFNKVLSTYVGTPDFTNWESIVKHCDEYYGPNHVLADGTTYDTMMIACEKYGRADDGLRWFDMSVKSSVTKTVTKVQKESLLRMIGDERYNEYTSKLSVEHQAKVMDAPPSSNAQAPSSSSLSAASVAPVSVPISVPVRALKSQGTVQGTTSSSEVKAVLPKSKKALHIEASVTTTDKAKPKSKSESESKPKPKPKPKSEPTRSKEVPPSGSSSIKTDLQSALKKVWVPSSSSSKVVSDSDSAVSEAVVVSTRPSSVDSAKSPKGVVVGSESPMPNTSFAPLMLTPSSIKNRLMRAASSQKANFYGVVEQILSALKAANVEPTVDIMNSLMMAHSWIGDVVATQRMIDEMKLLGLEPNAASISYLVSAYLRNSDRAGAEKAWTEALTGGLKPGMTYPLPIVEV